MKLEELKATPTRTVLPPARSLSSPAREFVTMASPGARRSVRRPWGLEGEGEERRSSQKANVMNTFDMQRRTTVLMTWDSFRRSRA
jgi:hypothetical protein